MNEEWRAVPGFEGFYEASSEGRVRSLDRIDAAGRSIHGRVLKPGKLKGSGRLQVTLSKDGLVKQMKVHQVVALAFHGECPEGMEVCHYPDRDVTDNRPDNLRYGTKRQNQIDSMEHGTHKETRKTHCPRGHLLVAPNLRVRKAAEEKCRECLACARVRSLKLTRPDVDMSSLADACYQEIMEGTPNPYRLTDWEKSQGRARHSSKTHCPRGHLLQEPNLSQHHLRRGARVCLSCIRAMDRIRRGSEGNKWAIADSIYEEVMDRG